MIHRLIRPLRTLASAALSRGMDRLFAARPRPWYRGPADEMTLALNEALVPPPATFGEACMDTNAVNSYNHGVRQSRPTTEQVEPVDEQADALCRALGRLARLRRMRPYVVGMPVFTDEGPVLLTSLGVIEGGRA